MPNINIDLLQLFVNAYRNIINQVLSKMLNNVMKFTPSGNIRISTNTNDPGHEVTDNIKDTEIGIGSKICDILF